VRDPAPLRADEDRWSADGVCLSRLRLPPAGDRPGRPRRSAPRRVVTPVPEPHPAATVVLLRPGADESEVLLIHRPSTMAFGPGLHAFPGGRVDPGDRGAAAAAGGLTADEAASVPPTRVVADDDDRLVLEFGSAGALPGRVGRTTLLGRRAIVVIDPGDPSDDATEAILAAADRRRAGIRAILLTQTDPDHAAG